MGCATRGVLTIEMRPGTDLKMSDKTFEWINHGDNRRRRIRWSYDAIPDFNEGGLTISPSSAHRQNIKTPLSDSSYILWYSIVVLLYYEVLKLRSIIWYNWYIMVLWYSIVNTFQILPRILVKLIDRLYFLKQTKRRIYLWPRPESLWWTHRCLQKGNRIIFYAIRKSSIYKSM